MSTVSAFALSSQLSIIPQGKAAGVKLFVPAEYGIDFTVGPNTEKQIVRDLLKSVDLPYALIFNGFFADTFHYFLGYNYAEGHIRVVGESNTAFSQTSRSDVGRFIAQALTTASPDYLEWAKLAIEGDRKTPLEIKAAAEKKLGKSFHVNFVDYSENAAKANSDFVAFLSQAVEDDTAAAGTPESVKATIAKFYPDWNPAPLEPFIVG